MSVHTLWRLGANIVAGHVSVHTLWRLGALFALSTCSGGSAQLWRLGALVTAVLEARRIVYIREHFIANAL